MNTLPPLPKTLISKEEAQNLLQPYVPTFWKIMVAVWEAWEGIPEQQRMMMTATARANNLFSFMVYYARLYFDGMKDVEILDRRIFQVGIKGLVLLRFKKLKSKDDKRSSNYPTLYQLKYSSQQTLPGMPPEAARLTVGYVLNLTQTAIEGVFCTYPNGKLLEWDFEIERPQQNVVALPALPQQRSKRKVRAKNVEVKKKAEKSNE